MKKAWKRTFMTLNAAALILALSSPAYAAEHEGKGKPKSSVTESSKPGKKGEEKNTAKQLQEISKRISEIDRSVTAIAAKLANVLPVDPATEDGTTTDGTATDGTTTDGTTTDGTTTDGTTTDGTTTDGTTTDGTTTDGTTTDGTATGGTTTDGTTTDGTTTEGTTTVGATTEDGTAVQDGQSADDQTNVDDNEDSEDSEEAEDEGEDEVDVDSINGYVGKLNANFNKLNAVTHQLDAIAAKDKTAKLEALYAAVQALQDKITAELAKLNGAVQSAQHTVLKDKKNKEGYKKLAKLSGKKGINTFVNGEEINFDVQPVQKEGRTLVPFRAVAEKMKATVTWDEATSTVTVKKGNVTVNLVIGSITATINDKDVPLDVPAEVTDGRTIVPIRFLTEALGADVQWDEETSSVIVVEQ